MPRSLAILLSVTDVSFLLYWVLAGLSLSGVIQLPAEWMYAHYERADVVAWNWSFFPMDVAFSVCGLLAVRFASRGDARWVPFALVSLTLTMAAGLMAVSYWVLMCEFDPAWFLSNALLVIWPLYFFPRLIRSGAATAVV